VLDQFHKIVNRNLFISANLKLAADLLFDRKIYSTGHVIVMHRPKVGIFQEKFALDSASKRTLGHIMDQVEGVFSEYKIGV